MKSFLVLVDMDGSIIEIKWCEPIRWIDEKTLTIHKIFEVKNREPIQHIILESYLNGAQLSHIEDMTSILDHTNLQLSCIKSNSGIYVFAYEHMNDGESNAKINDLISRFLYLIQSNIPNLEFKNPESTRFQFEEIQLLNNELVNTKRMLQKSNAQLNLLNRDLNNRLVKDPLTGLVSRYQYRSEIEYQIRQNPEKLGVFMFMDIDDFKRINDAYGHSVGDAYLVEFANRLNRIPVTDSVKLRIAGDEFGWFVYGLTSVENVDLDAYWELIKRYILSEPFVYEKYSLTFSLSVGMSIYGVDTDEIYEIIDFADFAMYCSKKRGKNSYSRFNHSEYKKNKL